MEAAAEQQAAGAAAAAAIPTLGAAHDGWMQAAFEQGEVALGVSEVPVGCVFVADGAVIAASRNFVNEKKNATRHAEMECIDQIIEQHGVEEGNAILKRTELYVTCEPCIMCASALAQVGVAKIWFGCRNDRFGGCGTVLDSYGLSIPGGARVANAVTTAAAAEWTARTANGHAQRRLAATAEDNAVVVEPLMSDGGEGQVGGGEGEEEDTEAAAAAAVKAAAAAARASAAVAKNATEAAAAAVKAREAAASAGVGIGVLSSHRFSGEISNWVADGCEFVSGFGEDEAIGLLKRFYEIGNPRTKAMEAAAAEAAAAAAAEGGATGMDVADAGGGGAAAAPAD